MKIFEIRNKIIDLNNSANENFQKWIIKKNIIDSSFKEILKADSAKPFFLTEFGSYDSCELNILYGDIKYEIYYYFRKNNGSISIGIDGHRTEIVEKMLVTIEELTEEFINNKNEELLNIILEDIILLSTSNIEYRS